MEKMWTFQAGLNKILMCLNICEFGKKLPNISIAQPLICDNETQLFKFSSTNFSEGINVLWQSSTVSNICANLYFPQCFAAGGRSGRLPAGGSEKNMLALPVVVTREELLLFSVKQPHYVSLHHTQRGRFSGGGLEDIFGFSFSYVLLFCSTTDFMYTAILKTLCVLTNLPCASCPSSYSCAEISKNMRTYPFEYCFLVVAPFHEQNNFPTCVAINRINLKAKSRHFKT